MALSANGSGEDDDETTEDKINRLMESKRLLTNASYFAFTATPKNKDAGNLRHEGRRRPGRPAPALPRLHDEAGDPGRVHHRRGVELHAGGQLLPAGGRRWRATRSSTRSEPARSCGATWRTTDHAIRLKAEIMVDHFHEQVAGQRIGGQARAMVVTSSIRRAVSYYAAIRDYLAERKSPYQAIVAFSGEHEFGDGKVTESSMNGFSSSQIAAKIQEDPYRFLVCADKFQTGYDEPLLHTMYVDKILSGVKAVQTLSRLNRAHPKKHDAFVLDFTNDAETIPERLCRLLPDDRAGRGNRRQPAARPAGDAGRRASVRPRAGGRVGGVVPERRGPRPAGSDPGHVCCGLSGGSWTRTSRWSSRGGRRRSYGRTGSWRRFFRIRTRSGKSGRSS